MLHFGQPNLELQTGINGNRLITTWIGTSALDRAVDYWGPYLACLMVAGWLAAVVVGFVPIVAVFTALGFAAALIGVWRPVIGLFGVGMLTALDFPSRVYLMTGGLLRWSTFDYWLALIAAIGAPLLLRRLDLSTRWLLGFIGLRAIQTVYSPDSYGGVHQTLASVVTFGFLVYFYRAARDGRVWYWLAVALGVFTALGAIVYWVQFDRLPPLDPNAAARMPLVALFSICLATAFGQLSSRNRLILGLLAGINLALVILPGSRGAILVGLCCAIYLFYQTPGVVRRCAWMSIAGLVCVLIMGLFPERLDYTINRIALLLDSQESHRARTSGRSNLALDGWQIFADHPLLGVGTGGFAAVRIERSDRTGTRGFANKKLAAHSAWIKALAENGLLGFSLLCGFVLSFAAAGWRQRHLGMFAFGATVTVALTAAYLSSELSDVGLWFFAAGGIVGMSQQRGDDIGADGCGRPVRAPESGEPFRSSSNTFNEPVL